MMRIQFFILTAALGITGYLFGQAPAKSAAKFSAIPRMTDGHPDLQGTYDLATMTPVERARGSKGVFTKAEAAKKTALLRRPPAASRCVSIIVGRGNIHSRFGTQNSAGSP